MTTPAAAPQAGSPAPAATPVPPDNPDSQEPPFWRLAFLLATSALEGSWTKFLRSVALLLILIAAVALLAHLLGPYVAGGLGLGSVGTAALTRHARTKAEPPPAAK
jgi:hypothetical protein